MAHSMANDPIHELRADQMLTQYYSKSWEMWLEKGVSLFSSGNYLLAANDLAKAQGAAPTTLRSALGSPMPYEKRAIRDVPSRWPIARSCSHPTDRVS